MAKAIKNKGSVVRIWGRFADPDTKEPLDPTTLTLKVQAPDGTVTTTDQLTDFTKTATGIYFWPLVLSQAGDYTWKYIATNGAGRGVVLNGSLTSMARGSY